MEAEPLTKSVEFPDATIHTVWMIQNGRCGHCGKSLFFENRDRGLRGAWHAHHRIPVQMGGQGTVENCVLLCINPPENCHSLSHPGGTENQVIIPKLSFLYRYYGEFYELAY